MTLTPKTQQRLFQLCPLQQLEIYSVVWQTEKSGKFYGSSESTLLLLSTWIVWWNPYITKITYFWKVYLRRLLKHNGFELCYQTSLYDSNFSPKVHCTISHDVIKIHSVLEVREKSTPFFFVKPKSRQIQP